LVLVVMVVLEVEQLQHTFQLDLMEALQSLAQLHLLAVEEVEVYYMHLHILRILNLVQLEDLVEEELFPELRVLVVQAIRHQLLHHKEIMAVAIIQHLHMVEAAAVGQVLLAAMVLTLQVAMVVMVLHHQLLAHQ